MIEGSKQQQLTFEKGITNVPSDLLCSDNALEESVGMIYDNGEHRVIQSPELVFDNVENGKVLYVHNYNNSKRYIKVVEYKVVEEVQIWKVQWYENFAQGWIDLQLDGNTVEFTDEDVKISSIGKTLIIADSNGMHYFLWKVVTYKCIGDIPSPNVDFRLYNSPDDPEISEGARNSGSAEGVVVLENDGPRIIDQEAYNNLVIGLYSKNKKAVAQEKGFCNPFFIRCALELYDGTYTKVTNPVLMFPSVTANSVGRLMDDGVGRYKIILDTKAVWLYYNQDSDYSEFTDIVKSIAIFISEPFDVYETGVDQGISLMEIGDIEYDGIDGILTPDYYIHPVSAILRDPYVSVLKKRHHVEFDNFVSGESVFYKLCEIGLQRSGFVALTNKIGTHTLEFINTEEHLEYDDYFSHCKLRPSFLYSYNSRLNIANASRSFFEGFHHFLPYCNEFARDYVFYVKIETETGDIWVCHKTKYKEKQGIYFYYPDSRARHVTIYKGNEFLQEPFYCVLDAELQEHPALHGAYYFKGFPFVPYEEQTVTVGPNGYKTDHPYTDIADNGSFELLPNYIITSEANNPFVFNAQGYYKVGTGKILGMSTVTQALSEGQFGVYPLLVFSKVGIWALSVAETGYYSSCHPVSREVSLDPAHLLQTDGAIFFTSEKGLMAIVGNQVKCVSEQLSGKTNSFSVGGEDYVIDLGNFKEYLKESFMAYDYRDSLIWIYNQSYKYCYVYSIKSGTFAKFQCGETITNTINDYPDYLMQRTRSEGHSYLFSFLNRPDINSDREKGRVHSGFIITRPMKLENGLALKSLMQVRHIKQMQGNMTLRIFASNNTEHWVELHSLRGTPWKYYRFRYDFTSLAATDRFAGSVVITQERRTDKLL